MDSNHRTQMRTDLQSAAFSHSATYPCAKMLLCLALCHYTIRNKTCQYFFEKKLKKFMPVEFKILCLKDTKNSQKN